MIKMKERKKEMAVQVMFFISDCSYLITINIENKLINQNKTGINRYV